MAQNHTIPKYVFVVPYRNRPQQKLFFTKYITSILPPEDKYEIYITHQFDERPFNRGAIKNIGFLAIKQKYPNHYKNICIVFNDIDLVPFANIFNYCSATHGTVKHYYGFKYALGGIVAITGGDFEASTGFPNFWGWGMEDRIFQIRCERIGLRIDRSTFYPVGSPEILHLFDGISRIINPKESERAVATEQTMRDGIRNIKNVRFTIDSVSAHPPDNKYVIASNKIFVVNIIGFDTSDDPSLQSFHAYDLRDPVQNIMKPTTNRLPPPPQPRKHILHAHTNHRRTFG